MSGQSRILYWIIVFSLFIGIGFSVYIPKVASASLFIIAIFCSFGLKREQWFKKDTRFIWISFSAPIFAILIASAFRGEFVARDFDSASRILLGIPVFIYFARQTYDIKTVVSAGILTALIIGPLFINPEKTGFYGGRYATAYSDVNSLAAILVLFLTTAFYTLLCKTLSRKSIFVVFVTAMCSGIYVLLYTGARGPILVFICMIFIITTLRLTAQRVENFLRIAASTLLVIALPLVLVFSNPNLKNRISSISIEIFELAKGHNKSETSSGIRVSMLKLSTYLFAERPLEGWGDLRNAKNIKETNPEQVLPPHVIEATKLGGPHNELAARALESGIWGVIGFCLLHFLPFYVLRGKSREKSGPTFASNQSIVFISTLFLLGFTLETFSLKYMVSVNTIFMAIVLSEAYKEKHASQSI